MSISLPRMMFAFSAGILSIFSPCGYVLLPAYVSYYLGSRISLGRAIYGGIICTMGLMTVFSVVGGLASSLGELVPQIIPSLDLLAGFILIIMGIITLKQVGIPYFSIPVKSSQRRGLLGIYIFGLVYGLAGVGCSAPIFLSVLVYSISSGLINGVITFIIYALGMGVPLIITSVLLAEAKEYIIRKISRATPLLQKSSGIVLIIVGIYLLYLYVIS